ncbi:MAG: phosphatase PAP2 family protein [Haloferacaceae archaeon]
MRPLAPRASSAYEPIAAVPDLLAAPVTLLGDPLVLLALVAVGYWRAPPVAEEPRRAFATLVGVGLASAGLVLALKGLFALPRPPGATATGYGFPSGHALGAAAVYGGAARLFDRVDPTRRRLAAGLLVAAVALSRVALGVHYLVDVVAGAALGLALAVALDRPRRALLAAGGCGLAAVVVAGATAVVAGGAAGAALGPDDVGDAPLSLRVVTPAIAAVVGLGAVLTTADLPLGVSLLGGGAMLWGVVALPRLAKKW